jgi:hypothetical protein
MIKHLAFNRIATGLAVMLIAAGSWGEGAIAAIALKDGDSVNGFVRSTSPSFQFRSPAKPKSPLQSAKGEDYTFTAQRGATVEISVEAEDGSSLKPVLVLLSPSGKQVGYDDSLGLLRYRVPTTGTYRLLVLGRNNSLGRYTLEINGLGTAAVTSEADQVMQDVLRLRIIGCGVPNVARIRIGAEERCTRDIEPGVYVYDASSKRITLLDSRRELLSQRLQLTLLERCPAAGSSVVEITLTDPQDGKDYTYCATPNRYVKAGKYRYDVAADDLQPLTATKPSPPTDGGQVSTPPPTSGTDARRQLLQTDYGLNVLASCPAARKSLAVISFPEEQETYVYCANPNRLVRAGEYVYNAKTNNLEPASSLAPNCTVSLGGVCIIK